MRPDHHKQENQDASVKAEHMSPNDLRERIAAFLFNCDYLSEWGDMSEFWFAENGEDYRDRAAHIVRMMRLAGPSALEPIN